MSSSASSSSNQPILKELQLSGWRQFEDVTLRFHPKMTILTGQNGAGKTTILNLIAPHFGWSIPMATVPSVVGRVVSYVTGVWQRVFGRAKQSDGAAVGRLTYSNDITADILVPEDASKVSTYRVKYSFEQPLQGLYVPSHRPLFLPSDVHVETTSSPWDRRHAFDAYVERFRPQWTGAMPQYLQGFEAATPLTMLKQVLLTLPEGSVTEDEAFSFRAFEAKLSKILPPSLRFESLERAGCEVVLNTSTGEFSLDAVSGGIAAVIDISWQIFLYPNTGPFVVLIDEPENHLHPEMQRTILPQLVEAFPQAQFIVTTHAPMVVTSMKDSAVYALIYEEPYGSVESGYEEPQPALIVGSPQHPWLRVHAIEQREFSRAGTADDTLRRILGLDYTMPKWAAAQLHQSAQIIVENAASPDSLLKVKHDLSTSGLGEYMSEVLEMADRGLNEPPPTAYA